MIDGLEDQWAEFEYLALHMDDYDEDEGFCSDPGACLSHGTTKDRTIINFCYQKVSIISAIIVAILRTGNNALAS